MLRNYSGGIEFINGTNLDTISVETDGQVVIDATCTSLNISLRGNMTITDGGTTTALTRDAALNAEYIVDQVYDEPNTGTDHNVANSGAKQWREGPLVIHSGTAQGPGTGPNQIQFDVGASAVDGTYDPAQVRLTDNTGVGQTRLIYQIEGANRRQSSS